MRNKILVLTFLCSIASGCCVTEHSQPELPSQVRGWQQAGSKTDPFETDKHERRLGLDRSVEVKKIVQNLEHALEQP